MTSINNFENYIIFEDGKIINCGTGSEVKSWKTEEGYLRVGFCKNGKQTKFYLHRLLALTFIPNPENLPEVDHIDRIRTNNNLENLHWVTSLENSQNKGKNKNNTSGNKNIHKHDNAWKFRKTINGKNYTKYSTDKQVVLDYKTQFYLQHNLKD